MRTPARPLAGVALAAALALTLVQPAPAAIAQPAVTYDIVYVRQPRRGDNEHIVWPEVFHPARIEPGSDLMLLHPDGSEEVLVAGGNGAVTDPFVSFDGQSVYYSLFPDVRSSELNGQRGDLPYAGADIYRIQVATREIDRLTFQEFTPNTGAGNWHPTNPVDPPANFNRLGYGILNLGPAPLAGGKIVFVSNRNGFIPPKGYTNPTLQLFVMDEDGSNVTPIAPMTIGSALHPIPLRDGRVLFSSFETQGLRDSRLWGLWSIWPDGRYWQPMVSAFKDAASFHFATQLGSGDVVIEDYYNLNNFGFGALYRLPVTAPAGQPRFHPARLSDNPPISQTVGDNLFYPFRMPFTPRGMVSITPFTNGEDAAAPMGPNGVRVGKFTHPSAAPGNNLLVAWSPGPVNALNRPTDLPAADAGLYVLPGASVIAGPGELTLIKNSPNYNEAWPRALVPYGAVHGIAQPAQLPWLPNDGAGRAELPAGTPFGLVGTSSFYKRESFPGVVTDPSFDGLDAFNTAENGQSSNWFTQGADAGKYADADIWAVRILAMEPNTHRSYGPHEGQHFFNHINEKLRILGEIPLRKFDLNAQPILDPEGNPDTSFLARIPADTPFTFQTLDRNGLVLNMSQTWHQVRPGEMRADCGGCHAHSQAPLPFESTAAGKPGYVAWDLARRTPLLTHDANGQPTVRTVDQGVVNVEFYRDIRPILQRSCAGCHTQSAPSPPGALVLDDLTLYPGPQFSGLQLPGDYSRLCFDGDARWGHPPLVTVGGDPVWRQSNASRYIRPFQSRRSLLVWKVFGARLDGWTDADHPTEAVPGQAGSLPPGANPNQADLDYTGTIMPPPGSGYPALSIDEKMAIARWIDLGCPINAGQGSSDEEFGWFVDDVRPALAVSQPRPGNNAVPLVAIRVGLADAYTGVATGTLSITASVPLSGRPAGAQLADLAQPAGDGVFVISVNPPITALSNARLHARVADAQGNVARADVAFSVYATPVSARAFAPLIGKNAGP
jgi:hypothetical protein